MKVNGHKTGNKKLVCDIVQMWPGVLQFWDCFRSFETWIETGTNLDRLGSNNSEINYKP